MTEQESSMFDGLDLDFQTRLEVIKAIATVLPTVKEAEQADDSIKELATLAVGNSGYQILNRELDLLATDMGVDLGAGTPAEKLAEVIDILDGTRRRSQYLR